MIVFDETKQWERTSWEAVRRGGLVGGAPDGEQQQTDANKPDAGAAGGDKSKQLELELAETKKKADALERKQRDADKKARDAEDAKRVEADGAKQLLAERSKELEEAKARLDKLTAAETARAERLFAALPEPRRKALEGFKDAMTPEKWTALLEAEGGTGAAPTEKAPLPPPSGTAMPQSRTGLGKDEHYKPSAESTKMLDELMVSDGALRKLDVLDKNDRPFDSRSGGNPKFTMPVKRLYENMNKQTGHKVVFKTEK